MVLGGFLGGVGRWSDDVPPGGIGTHSTPFADQSRRAQ